MLQIKNLDKFIYLKNELYFYLKSTPNLRVEDIIFISIYIYNSTKMQDIQCSFFFVKTAIND